MRLHYETAMIEPDITAVRLVGRLVTRLEGNALDAVVHELVSRGHRKIIFDLCGIEEFSSMACQLLLQCWSTVRKGGGDLLLATANPRVIRLCRIARLDSMLPFYRTVAAASQRFDLARGA
jgi:anti-anti-sigma factor